MGVEVGIHVLEGGSLGGGPVEGEIVVAADMMGVKGDEVGCELCVIRDNCWLRTLWFSRIGKLFRRDGEVSEVFIKRRGHPQCRRF